MRRFSFLKIVVFFIFLGGVDLLFSVNNKHKNTKQDTRQDNYTVYVGDYGLYRSFIEDTFRDHPVLFSAGFAATLGYFLYSKELQNFMHDYRDSLSLTAFGLLAVAFYYKDRIVDKKLVKANISDDGGEDESLTRFSRCGVRIFKPGDITTKFEDVAGLYSAKEDFKDILSFLKNPKTFVEMGAHIPKGVLLSGAPGNGKTLLARAVAGEANCPFLYISASEFVEAIVGMGAARIRNLFEVAKELAPCIIFIDEIDAIGKKRSAHGMSSDTELAQALNQLLSQMDGFEQFENPIVIIGATNRVDVLDAALMRPGRFDRKIDIGVPFKNDRIQILDTHFKKIKTAVDIDSVKIACGTIGFSGAELAQLVNEAAILAVRDEAKQVTMRHVDLARDYILLGRETEGMEVDKQEYVKTAIHEAGHALARVYQKNAKPLYKVTITPHAGSLGLTWGMDAKERYSLSEEELCAEIVVSLAGSVAEEIMYSGRGAGACSDLHKARQLATDMVMRYGMTDEFKDVSFEEFIHDQ